MRYHAKFLQNRSNGCKGITFDSFHNACLSSCICCMHFGTTHEEYLEVFIIVQNLIGMAAVVLMIWKFELFVCLVKKRLFILFSEAFLE